MLNMVKERSQNALERFFPTITEATHLSQQAFSRARQTVKGEAFRELLQQFYFYKKYDKKEAWDRE